MELLQLALVGGAMVVVVLGVGIAIEVLVGRRLGTFRGARENPQLQAHQQAVRSELGGTGPQG